MRTATIIFSIFCITLAYGQNDTLRTNNAWLTLPWGKVESLQIGEKNSPIVRSRAHTVQRRVEQIMIIGEADPAPTISFKLEFELADGTVIKFGSTATITKYWDTPMVYVWRGSGANHQAFLMEPILYRPPEGVPFVTGSDGKETITIYFRPEGK